VFEEVGESPLVVALVDGARVDQEADGDDAVRLGVVHDEVAHAVRQDSEADGRIGGDVALALRPGRAGRRPGQPAAWRGLRRRRAAEPEHRQPGQGRQGHARATADRVHDGAPLKNPRRQDHVSSLHPSNE
jgi:hypothetical protein